MVSHPSPQTPPTPHGKQPDRVWRSLAPGFLDPFVAQLGARTHPVDGGGSFFAAPASAASICLITGCSSGLYPLWMISSIIALDTTVTIIWRASSNAACIASTALSSTIALLRVAQGTNSERSLTQLSHSDSVRSVFDTSNSMANATDLEIAVCAVAHLRTVE